MSQNPSNSSLQRALPEPGGAIAPVTAQTAAQAAAAAQIPSRQLGELPKDELAHLAEEFGLDPTEFKTPQHLVAALHERRQLIASLKRDAMLDIIKWGRRPVTASATKEQLAYEIARIRSMRFAGLSDRGLETLARLRGVTIPPGAPIPLVIRRLKRQEGFFAKLNRKRRAFLGSMISNMIGEEQEDYQFLPPAGSSPGGGAGVGGVGGAGGVGGDTVISNRPGSIKEEIEESGLIGGIAGRIKKSADEFLHQKLDEIEGRIDRKLDEIDRRLAEWRDKEIANRIRILKITLWASVIVAAISLIISYLRIVWQTVK